MTRAIVYDRCVDIARALCAKLKKARISAVAVHPTDFDRTFEEGMPHLLVTELEMPMFSGFELLRQVRSEWSRDELPIIVYTSVDDALAWAKAKEIGANEIVAKAGADPVKRLEAAIARVLHRNDPRPPASTARPVRPPMRLISRWFTRPVAAAA
jgi:DNA-binding response OmpR family regulator